MAESIKFIIAIAIVVVIVVAILTSLLPMSARKNMQIACENFNKQYGHHDYNRLSIHISDDVLYANESVFCTDDPYFVLYDSEGEAVAITCERDEAIQRHETEGLYVMCVCD